jgi:hypothetical protein
VLVVDPHRGVESSRDLTDALSVTAVTSDAIADDGDEAVVVESVCRRFEDHDGAHVHRERRLLEVEEGRVQGTEFVDHEDMVARARVTGTPFVM